MSITWVRFFFWLYLLVIVWAGATFANPADPDLWHRLALGETLCQTGHFPAGDYFSYMADYKVIADHEWGSAVIFYGLYRAFGFDVFVGVKIIALTMTLVLVVWAGLYRRRPTILIAAFYALILLALLPNFLSTIRCMLFTHVFFALWLYWFQCERHGRPIPAYFYLGTMVLWANLHGGFVIGLAWLLMVAFVEWIDRGDWKAWLIRFGLCLLASLLNPFGAQLWTSTARALLITRHGFSEWEPVAWGWTQFSVYPGYKVLFLGMIVALCLHLYRRGWATVDRPAVLLIGIFMILSLISARHTSLFAMVAGALAPGLFAGEPGARDTMQPLDRLGFMALGTTLLIIPLYSAFLILPGKGLSLEFPPISCPRGAVDYLQIRKIRGNLLVPFNYGSYALWHLRGHMRVSMDGRYDLVYRPETYQKVDDFFRAKGNWQAFLNANEPDAILVPMDDAIYPKLLNDPAWKQAYHDDTDAVFLPLRVASL